MCATQVLGVSACKSSWGRTSNPQKAVTHRRLCHASQVKVWATKVPKKVVTKRFGKRKLKMIQLGFELTSYQLHMHACTHARMHTRTHAHTHACTHTHARMHTCMHACTHARMHTHTQAKYSYCCPANQHWDTCAPLRHLSLVQENSLGVGLATCRRTVQVSYREVMEPEVLQLHKTPLSRIRTVEHLLPQETPGTH